MNRDKREAHEKARSRILNDDESQGRCGQRQSRDGPFGAMVKLLVLTGQRREKVATHEVGGRQGWSLDDQYREP